MITEARFPQDAVKDSRSDCCSCSAVSMCNGSSFGGTAGGKVGQRRSWTTWINIADAAKLIELRSVYGFNQILAIKKHLLSSMSDMASTLHRSSSHSRALCRHTTYGRSLLARWVQA